MTEDDIQTVRGFFENDDVPGGLNYIHEILNRAPEDGAAYYLLSFSITMALWENYRGEEAYYYRKLALQHLPTESIYRIFDTALVGALGKGAVPVVLSMEELRRHLPEEILHPGFSQQTLHLAVLIVLCCDKPCSLLMEPWSILDSLAAVEPDRSIFFYLLAHICRHYDFTTAQHSLCYSLAATHKAMANRFDLEQQSQTIEPSSASTYYLVAAQHATFRDFYRHCYAQARQNF